MSRHVLLSTLSLLCVLGLAGCAGAGGAPAGGTAEAPTRNPRTPLALPAQPTSAPIPTRVATPFASATFAPIVSGPQSLPTGTPPRPAATTAGATPATQPAATQPEAGAAAPGVATGVRSEIKLEFAAALSTPEEVDEIAVVLKPTRGILDVSGTERTIAIGYDAGLILPDQIRALMGSIGHPVKP